MNMRTIARGLFAALAAVSLSACVGVDSEAELDEDVAVEEMAVRQFCGGIAGIACPAGFECVDDPSDHCDPDQGSADCGGVCAKKKGGHTQACDGADTKQYISTNPDECAVLRFQCAEGSVPFFDDCGCGCQVGAL